MLKREYRLIEENGDTTNLINSFESAEHLKDWLNKDTPFNYRIQFRDVPKWQDCIDS